MGKPNEQQDLQDRRGTLKFGVVSDCGTLEAVFYTETQARGLMALLGKGYKIAHIQHAYATTSTACHCKGSCCCGGPAPSSRPPTTFTEMRDRVQTLEGDLRWLRTRLRTLEEQGRCK